MHLVLKKRAPGQIEFGIIYGGIALLALFTARFLPVHTFLPSCAFKGFTGLPCPTCGSTRSVVHLAHGNIVASLAMNPLISMCFLAALLYLLYSIITFLPGIPRLGIVLTLREKNAVRVGAIVLLLVNWLYLVFTR